MAISDANPRGRAVDIDENAVIRKVAIRLIPFLFFLYVIAYLDRVNVGFAKLQMGEALGFSDAVYGAGAGIFFFGYFLFEVPSNLLLQRFGARHWIMRIMLTWGIVAMCMMFVNSITTFYVLRFLLGIAEAGFFPGILLYLTFWFTAKERAKVVAWFMTANAVSFIFGGPISGWLMTAKIIPGLAGWQQMFLLEGLPAFLMGFVVLWYLPNGPRDAKWLTEPEKDYIEARVEEEAGARSHDSKFSKSDNAPTLFQTFSQPAVIILCLCFFCFVSGMYGFSLWIPQIVKSMGDMTPVQTGFLSAIPFLISGTLMVVNGYHSDATGERPLHIFIPALFGAMGLVAYAWLDGQEVWQLVALSVAASGMWAMLGPFWAMVPAVLRGGGSSAVAGGLALINSVGNLGGFLGPFAVGKVKDLTGSFAGGVYTLATLVVIGAFLALIAGRMMRRSEIA